jgi:hypothetical protein
MSRPPLEPGVYQEVLGGKVNCEAVIIVRPGSCSEPWDNLAVAWRRLPDDDWIRGEGVFHNESLRPHPDGDTIWAEYCASLLQ